MKALERLATAVGRAARMIVRREVDRRLTVPSQPLTVGYIATMGPEFRRLLQIGLQRQ